MVITSTSNEKIKRLRALCKDKKYRVMYGEYVAEGTIIAKDMPDEDITGVYLRESESERLQEYFNPDKTFVVKNEIFDSVADTKTPSGVIATLKIPQRKEISGDVALLLCGLSDAGNVGTIIRTACARGINTVLCVDTADPYSPKSVRASMGGIAKVNVVICDYEEAFRLIEDYALVVLDMGGICIYDYKKEGKTVIAVGNEAHGVPRVVKEKCAVSLSIPMVEDGVESLNAAVSAAIAMYLL